MLTSGISASNCVPCTRYSTEQYEYGVILSPSSPDNYIWFSIHVLHVRADSCFSPAGVNILLLPRKQWLTDGLSALHARHLRFLLLDGVVLCKRESLLLLYTIRIQVCAYASAACVNQLL